MLTNAPPPGDISQIFGDPQTSEFRRAFGQLCDLIANVSGTQREIVNRKTTLQTTY